MWCDGLDVQDIHRPVDWIGQWDRCGVMSRTSMDSRRTSTDQWIGLDSGIDVV